VGKTKIKVIALTNHANNTKKQSEQIARILNHHQAWKNVCEQVLIGLLLTGYVLTEAKP